MPPVGSVTRAGWYLSELTVPGNFPQDLRRISQLSPMESHVHAPREPGTAHASPLHSPQERKVRPHSSFAMEHLAQKGQLLLRKRSSNSFLL